MSVKQQLEEIKQMLEAKRTARVKGDNSLNQTQTEITKLWNSTGRFQLELKCVLNEKELCAYRLAEERNKTHVLSTNSRTVLINEASLRSVERDGLTRPATVAMGVGLPLADTLVLSPTSISREETRHTSVQFGTIPPPATSKDKASSTEANQL